MGISFLLQNSIFIELKSSPYFFCIDYGSQYAVLALRQKAKEKIELNLRSLKATCGILQQFFPASSSSLAAYNVRLPICSRSREDDFLKIFYYKKLFLGEVGGSKAWCLMRSISAETSSPSYSPLWAVWEP